MSLAVAASVPIISGFSTVRRVRGYWEHLGMLGYEQYRARWERKLAWNREQNILPREKGGGEKGTLITTRDAPDGGLSSHDVKALIKQILG